MHTQYAQKCLAAAVVQQQHAYLVLAEMFGRCSSIVVACIPSTRRNVWPLQQYSSSMHTQYSQKCLAAAVVQQQHAYLVLAEMFGRCSSIVVACIPSTRRNVWPLQQYSSSMHTQYSQKCLAAAVVQQQHAYLVLAEMFGRCSSIVVACIPSTRRNVWPLQQYSSSMHTQYSQKCLAAAVVQQQHAYLVLAEMFGLLQQYSSSMHTQYSQKCLAAAVVQQQHAYLVLAEMFGRCSSIVVACIPSTRRNVWPAAVVQQQHAYLVLAEMFGRCSSYSSSMHTQYSQKCLAAAVVQQQHAYLVLAEMFGRCSSIVVACIPSTRRNVWPLQQYSSSMHTQYSQKCLAAALVQQQHAYLVLAEMFGRCSSIVVACIPSTRRNVWPLQQYSSSMHTQYSQKCLAAAVVQQQHAYLVLAEMFGRCSSIVVACITQYSQKCLAAAVVQQQHAYLGTRRNVWPLQQYSSSMHTQYSQKCLAAAVVQQQHAYLVLAEMFGRCSSIVVACIPSTRRNVWPLQQYSSSMHTQYSQKCLAAAVVQQQHATQYSQKCLAAAVVQQQHAYLVLAEMFGRCSSIVVACIPSTRRNVWPLQQYSSSMHTQYSQKCLAAAVVQQQHAYLVLAEMFGRCSSIVVACIPSTRRNVWPLQQYSSSMHTQYSQKCLAAAVVQQQHAYLVLAEMFGRCSSIVVACIPSTRRNVWPLQQYSSSMHTQYSQKCLAAAVVQQQHAYLVLAEMFGRCSSIVVACIPSTRRNVWPLQQYSSSMHTQYSQKCLAAAVGPTQVFTTSGACFIKLSKNFTSYIVVKTRQKVKNYVY